MIQKNKPIAKADLKPIDRYLNVLSWVFLAVLVVIPLAYWSQLPDMLPSHFNFRGVPDNFASKNSVWTLPVLGVVLLSLFSFLNKVPHLFNYPVEITMQNAPRQYAWGIRIMGIIKLLLVVWLNSINYASIQIGLGNINNLGTWLMPAFLSSLLVVIVIFIGKARRLA